MHAPEIHTAARNLLHQTLEILRARGWHKTRIDTYTHPDWPGHTIRHHYAGGEYRLIRNENGEHADTATWDTRRQLPTIEQILTQLGLLQPVLHNP